ncbi:MAG: hypothetical protein AB1696_27865 [Planctomycetota bacterium]
MQETVLCKRGKLILEDDFSGKNLLWTFDPDKCHWAIAEKALVTESTGDKVALSIERPITPVANAVFEMRVFLPRDCTVALLGTWTNFPFARISPTNGKLTLVTWSKETGMVEVAMAPFPYPEARWIDVLYEVSGSSYALTVDDQTVTCDMPFSGERSLTKIVIRPEQKTSSRLMVDDIKVWEALPKRR